MRVVYRLKRFVFVDKVDLIMEAVSRGTKENFSFISCFTIRINGQM